MDLTKTHFWGIEAQTWIEMLVGIFIEAVLIAGVFYYLQARSQRKSEKHISQHMNEIEKYIIKQTNELRIYIQQERKEKQHGKDLY